MEGFSSHETNTVKILFAILLYSSDFYSVHEPARIGFWHVCGLVPLKNESLGEEGCQVLVTGKWAMTRRS
jgi:hypothetical protein